MVGSALLRRIEQEGCIPITAERAEVDLTRQDQVEAWISKSRPHAIFLAAAKVGGIVANNRRLSNSSMTTSPSLQT
jgi:GDP-L-fucose synthase